MISYIQDLIPALSGMKELIGLLSLGGFTILSSVRELPKLGPARATTIFLKSVITNSASPMSVRSEEVFSLNTILKDFEKGNYVVITGAKGIGKSCLINSALHRSPGVLHVGIESGESKSSIVLRTMQEITNITYHSYDLTASTKRVLWFYKYMFWRPVKVVIQVPERQREQKYADITAAVRDLADNFNLHVIVDGCPNSIPPEIQSTERQINILVMPMSREMIENIPELKHVMTFLKQNHLDTLLWEVLGGSPQCYMNIRRQFSTWKRLGKSDEEIIAAVKSYVVSLLILALKEIINSSTNTKEIMKVFREGNHEIISEPNLMEKGFLIDYPNNVFQGITTGEENYVEPASPAIGLIIKRHIEDNEEIRPFVEELFAVSKTHI